MELYWNTLIQVQSQDFILFCRMMYLSLPQRDILVCWIDFFFSAQPVASEKCMAFVKSS